ncbi:MAG: TGS domain-containing protein [Lentimicrobiaceae bacterium]|nr:TGS domain-containing protein [Lentimicrobiaceae bacterium]
MIEIVCINKGNLKKQYPHGTTLGEIAADLKIELQYPVLGARVNNQLKSLSHSLYTDRVIEFFDASSLFGYTMYGRSLSFLLYKAAKDLFPQEEMLIKHSISGGRFCEFENPDFEVNDAVVTQIEQRMRELVAADLPFIRKKMLTEEAVALYESHEMWDKQKLLKHRKIFYTSVYEVGGTINYFFGCLVPSTAYLDCFGLIKYENGLLLKTPSRKTPAKLSPPIMSPKLFHIIKEHKEWSRIMEVPYVGDLNDIINANRATDLLLMSEALQEKKLISIADDIKSRKDIKVVLISGPSSSGKTTSCRRLSVQLGVLGYKPVQISADNYFVDRTLTPKDADGNYDFEHINALDLPLFNQQLSDLIAGKEVETPVFDFHQGKKVWKGDKMKMEKNAVIVIEGIHCLNPLLTQKIDQNLTYKVFVSALTSLAMDKHNPIHSNDNRLVRRIVRDFKYRGYSAQESLRRWASVRNGEERWVFPFQENADSMFNSAMLCELSLFKRHALPLLEQVPENVDEKTEAARLIKLLNYFTEISDAAVPHYSILREFFGGSVFSY